jgi:hypothetical protein
VPTHVPLDLPVSNSGLPLYARSSQPAEAWPGLVEKAYVMKRRHLADDPTTTDYVFIDRHRQDPPKAAQLLAGGIARMRTAATESPEHGQSAHVMKLCDERGVTRLPVMAWTWSNLSDRGVGWKVTGLVGNHSYAVLGTCTEGAQEFVVVRNPWGGSVIRLDGYPEGPWKPGPGRHGDAQVTLNSNGVFGLKREWFDKAMFRIGWLQPAHS